MLYAYYDESGINGARVVVIGGLLGSLTVWRTVEAEWVRHLEELGVSKFHATECMAGKGDYATIDRWKRNYHFNALAKIIAGSKLYALTNSVILDNWAATVGDFRGRFPHQFDFIAEMHIATIARYSRELWDGEPVQMIFSPQSQFAERVTRVWQKYAQQAEGKIIDSIIFANKSNRPALQAADYLTYEVMKFHQTGDETIVDSASPLLSGLAKRRAGFVCEYHTYETITEIIKRGPIGRL